MQYQKKIYCKGIACNNYERKFKCSDCKVYLCGVCVITSMADKKARCPNCYAKTFSPDWDKLNKEFEEMLEHNKKTTHKLNCQCKECVDFFVNKVM